MKVKIKYCIDCNKQLNLSAYCQRTVRCRSCSTIQRFKNPENNPAWKGGKPKCIDCGKQLVSYTAKRCRSCESKQQAKIRKIPANYIDGRCLKTYNCKDCNKKINFHTALYGQGRCRKCANKKSSKIRIENRCSYKNKNNPNWQDGISQLPYAFEFTSELKLKIRKRDNYTCKLCSMTEEEHLSVYGKVLSVHHIDYNKENCNEDNLITLCKQCNTRVNYNRNYWFAYFTYIMENYIYVYQKNFA